MPSRLTLAASLLAAIALTSLITGLHSAPAAAAESAPVTAVNLQTEPINASRFPTAAPVRMPSRRPGPSPSAARASQGEPRGAFELRRELRPPHRAHGRIFFRKPGSDTLYSCSGTVVRSASERIVFTAGHCIYDHERQAFHSDVTFVPAYRDGEAPLGTFAADSLSAPKGWVEQGEVSYDIGLVTLEEEIEPVTGGRGVSFGETIRSLGRLLIYGYPVLPGDRYDGERPIVCDAAFRRAFRNGHPPSLAAHPCDMQQGASGGAWISRRGYMVSVVSHGVCDSLPELCDHVIGPYFGQAALRLYRRAGGSERVRLGIAQVPGAPFAKGSPVFRIRTAASTPLEIECRVDGMKWRSCRKRVRLRSLSAGRHVLRVRVRDQVGRVAQRGRSFRVTPRSSRGSAG